MTIAQSPFSGNCRVVPRFLPMTIMLMALPFHDFTDPSRDLAVAFGWGADVSACALVALFLLFVAVRPAEWSPRRAVETAEAITLWLAAGVVVTCFF